MSRFSVIALDELGTMEVLEKLDSEAIIASRMVKLRELWAENDPPMAAQYDVGATEFDPLRINQEANAYFELMLRDRVNQAARKVTLAFATGTNLDAIGSRYPGGMPRLEGESDDAYRRRIWLSPNGLSPHGTEEGYTLWALTSDPNVRDASAWTIEGTGEVTVTVMMQGANPTPTIPQLLAVRTYLFNEGRKGTTDDVTVTGPRITETDIRVRVWLFPGVTREMVLANAQRALEALKETNRWLGVDLTILDISAALKQNGVWRAEIDEPKDDILIDQRGLVMINTIEVSYAGRGE